jgi:xanthine/uracil/vitamin C permease (AzgA family)
MRSQGFWLLVMPLPPLQSKRLHSAALWLGASGLAIMVLLMGRRVKGAIMMGILFVTFISWIPNHRATYFGEESDIKGECQVWPWFGHRVGCRCFLACKTHSQAQAVLGDSNRRCMRCCCS